jgi:hypothetical protein
MSDTDDGIGLCRTPSRYELKTTMESNDPCLRVVYALGQDDEAAHLVVQNVLFDALALVHMKVGALASRFKIDNDVAAFYDGVDGALKSLRETTKVI